MCVWNTLHRPFSGMGPKGPLVIGLRSRPWTSFHLDPPLAILAAGPRSLSCPAVRGGRLSHGLSRGGDLSRGSSRGGDLSRRSSRGRRLVPRIAPRRRIVPRIVSQIVLSRIVPRHKADRSAVPVACPASAAACPAGRSAVPAAWPADRPAAVACPADCLATGGSYRRTFRGTDGLSR